MNVAGLNFERITKSARMKNTTKLLLLGCLLFVLTAPSCSGPRKTIVVEEGWEMLGTLRVNFLRDKDELAVTSENQFTAIKFMVEDHDVHINDVKVYFKNGDKLDPTMDDVVPANQYSREIQIGQEGRRLDHLQFKYRTTGSVLKGRANVLVFGKKLGFY
jgi:hypothetical protein